MRILLLALLILAAVGCEKTIHEARAPITRSQAR